MKATLRFLCLLPFALRLGLAQAQTPTTPELPRLPATALQPVVVNTVPAAAAGVRFQYQQVRLYNDQCVYLAPAWRGRTKLEPTRKSLFASPDLGELDGLLLTALNELAAEGWELVEIQTVVQPVKATQKLETALAYNDPQRPTYTGTTTLETLTHTRYLFRRPLGK